MGCHDAQFEVHWHKIIFILMLVWECSLNCNAAFVNNHVQIQNMSLNFCALVLWPFHLGMELCVCLMFDQNCCLFCVSLYPLSARRSMVLIAWLNDIPPGQYHCVHHFNSIALLFSDTQDTFYHLLEYTYLTQ